MKWRRRKAKFEKCEYGVIIDSNRDLFSKKPPATIYQVAVQGLGSKGMVVGQISSFASGGLRTMREVATGSVWASFTVCMCVDECETDVLPKSRDSIDAS